QSMHVTYAPKAGKPTNDQLERLTEADRVLLLKLLEEPAEYVNHELFQKPNAEKILFGQKAHMAPDSTYFEEVESVDPSSGQSGSGATLSTAQEILLFQRFNYARMRTVELLMKHEDKTMPFDVICELLAWGHRALMARGQITQANVPLVLAMAKRTRLNGLDFNDLISEGDFALLRSIDKFDCSSGFKFSTYACRAILKSFSRVALRTSRYRGHFPTEFDPMLEKSDFIERKRDGIESECVDELRDIITDNLAELNEMEQTVIRERFALEAADSETKPKTLEQVGDMIGVTKERVRQIQNKALKKIRSILEDNFLAA
ncbi:MAG: sigma-70 family RNA polymerase sigma factor, partial [Planctomycetota bacterium]